jgi:hypothetical protein
VIFWMSAAGSMPSFIRQNRNQAKYPPVAIVRMGSADSYLGTGWLESVGGR